MRGDAPTQEHLDAIEEWLQAPPSWRDPVTGLPAGFTDDEDDDWAAFEQAMRE